MNYPHGQPELTPEQKEQGRKLRDEMGHKIAALLQQGYTAQQILTSWNDAEWRLRSTPPPQRKIGLFETLTDSDSEAQRIVKETFAEVDALEAKAQTYQRFANCVFTTNKNTIGDFEDFDQQPKNVKNATIQHYGLQIFEGTKADLEVLASEKKIQKQMLGKGAVGISTMTYIITEDLQMVRVSLNPETQTVTIIDQAPTLDTSAEGVKETLRNSVFNAGDLMNAHGGNSIRNIKKQFNERELQKGGLDYEISQQQIKVYQYFGAPTCPYTVKDLKDLKKKHNIIQLENLKGNDRIPALGNVMITADSVLLYVTFQTGVMRFSYLGNIF